MDLPLRFAVLPALILASVSCGVTWAGDLATAKSAAVAQIRAKLSPDGELIANRPDGSLPRAKAVAKASAPPLPRPRITAAGTDVGLPAAKDPVAHRLALAFAATHAPDPEVTGSIDKMAPPEPAVPAVFALAYADTSGEVEKRRSTRALSAIEELVETHADKHDVPPALAHALVQVESSYRPKATGRRGEIGLMQITPKTARALGYKGSAKALYDPETNLTWGMKYLAKARKLAGGDLCGTLLRYNAGLDAKRRSKGSSRFCAKVKKVMARRD